MKTFEHTYVKSVHEFAHYDDFENDEQRAQFDDVFKIARASNNQILDEFLDKVYAFCAMQEISKGEKFNVELLSCEHVMFDTSNPAIANAFYAIQYRAPSKLFTNDKVVS